MNIFKLISNKFSLKYIFSLLKPNRDADTWSKEERNNFVAMHSGNTVIYRYNDKSVPPQYHRSYTITVTIEKIYVSINSYGNILLKKTLPISLENYQSLITTLIGLNIKKCEEVNNYPMPGSSSSYLNICIGKEFEVVGNTNVLEGDVGMAIKIFIALVPKLDKWINSTRKH